MTGNNSPLVDVPRARPTFRQWRRSRPFWAALVALGAGFVILGYSLVYGGASGLSGGVIGALLMAFGLFQLVAPERARAAFRRWRRTRPFWAGVWTLLGGFVIFYYPLAPIAQLVHAGVGGISGVSIGVLLMIFGLFQWLTPKQHMVVGVLSIMLSLLSFPLSNFGGFFFGMIFGIVGGSMGFGWLPAKPTKKWRHFKRVASAVDEAPAEELPAPGLDAPALAGGA